jgi:glyoxylase-like metal-dependent hydrolase (beta-lactamase superfamily II)
MPADPVHNCAEDAMPIEFRENEVFEVGPGVWIRNMVDNAAWADLGNGAAVIDALDPADDAPMEVQIPEDVRRTTGKPLKWLLMTHWHPDHTGFIAPWKQAGATVIAHRSCAEAESEPARSPDITFDGTYTVEGAGRQARMEWLGGTHTPWDTVVYFPWARVLHIADLFGWGMIPLAKFDPEKIDLLKQRLARVLEYDADSYIVGHGPVAKPEHIRRWLAYLDDLLARVPPLAKAGKSLEETEKEVPVPADMDDWWKLGAWKHGHNLKIIANHFA